MAEGPDNTAEELEQEITCPVCHEHFGDPRILPCSHVYCKECVQALADRALPNQPFHCPECRAETLLPQNDPNLLPRALLAVRMKDFHAKLVDERKPLHKMCSKHNDPLKLFCFDCNCLICGQCAAFDHKTHTYEFVSNATPQCRELLVKQVTPLKTAHKSYSDAADRAKAMISEIETQNTENIGAIEGWVERYVQLGCSLVEEVSSSSKQKIVKLKAQIKEFEGSFVLIQSLEEFCEQNLENAADEEFIESHEQILSRVEDECKKHKDANLELAEEADIGVELPLNYHNEAKVVILNADPANCTVNLESAEVNKSSRLTVYTLYRNGAPCKKLQTVKGELNSLVDGSLVRIKGTPTTKGGVYEMVYKPQIRGRHQLAVTVNGEQVAGSPFTMCVQIPPTQLGTSLRVIRGLNIPAKGYGMVLKSNKDGLDCPYGVAFNSAGELLIALSRGYNVGWTKIMRIVIGCVVVLDKHGEYLRTLNYFENTRGIAVDKEDNIFVADGGPHCVYKLDKEGNRLKAIGRRGSGIAEFENPWGVAVIGEHVYVCDSDNDRIQVFTRELEFVKVIGSRGTGNGQFKKVYDMSQDEAGNLYVCDFNNHRIQVLSNEGEFLFSFGTEGEGEAQLDHPSHPSSVCVSDQFVYVSEYSNAHVSVFDKKGVFVTSFKPDGGWFSSHSNIRVDKDGFVYFCDQAYNRVQIF